MSLFDEDWRKAADCFNAAAEEAQVKLKGKLAMKYLERAAEAEGILEEEEPAAAAKEEEREEEEASKPEA